MAFNVDKGTMAISMHKGDTGAFWVQLQKKDGGEFATGDVAIFEIWQGQTRKAHREFDLQPETPTEILPGDGKFLISFRNSDTDTWTAGSYNTEIRTALSPIRSAGQVVDGNTVRTIIQSTLTILDVKIDI